MEYFDEMATEIKTAARVIRPTGIVLTIFGLFLLFMPIIALLKWIPLVGWLLSGVVTIAAFVFAFIVGLVLSLLVICIAWVFHRPLIGILMLTLVGIGVYFIFFFDVESFSSSVEAEVTSEVDKLADSDSSATADTAATADSTVTSHESTDPTTNTTA